MGEKWTHHLDLDTKRCSGCKEIKPVSAFAINRARYDGLINYCQECRLDREAKRRAEKRKALVESFGGKCVRCGFSDWRALQFDHVNNDGAVDRKDGKSQGHLLRLLRENPSRFQLLCANCNQIKRYEERECPGRSDQVATVPTERSLVPRQPSRPRASYSSRRTEEAIAKAKELADLVESRRETERSPVFLTGYWSRYYKRCLGCQGTDRSHASDGCCYKCDKIIKGYNRRVSVFGQPASAVSSAPPPPS